MWQSGTIRIAKIGGIAVDIHFTFALVILWGAYDGWIQYGGSLEGALYGVVAILLLFGCVLLHELAHGLQARALGLVVRRVILYPIGGIAVLETQASSPWDELVYVLAGPLLNLVLATVLAILLIVTTPQIFGSPADLVDTLRTPSLVSAVVYLTLGNLSLFIFNIIPAFPMDGGRLLRAGLALTMPYVNATRIAAWIGRALALVMGLASLVLFFVPGPLQYSAQNILLLLVAVIVFIAAYNEEIFIRRQWALARVEVGQVFRKRIETISPWDDLTNSLIAELFRYERILPVIVDERIVGLLSYDEAHRFVSKTPTVTVAHAMRTNFPTLRPRDTLWVALQAMTADHLAMLPVVEENKFQGMVNLDDIKEAWRLA